MKVIPSIPRIGDDDWPNKTVPGDEPLPSENRITEDGNQRITEDGNERITE